MYVATRGLYGMKPPTIFVPKAIKENVERLFEVHREMDQSELKHNLIVLDVGEVYLLFLRHLAIVYGCLYMKVLWLYQCRRRVSVKKGP